jgi:predicted CXXCH cytochrome family protein
MSDQDVERAMKLVRRFRFLVAGACVLAAAFALPAVAQDAECTQCHSDLVRKATVHAAVRTGCKTCHDQLDATNVPHKSTGKAPKGLSDESPALCGRCHQKALFEGKLVHGPVAAGMCAACHDPHAADNVGLLKKDPAALCLDCHANVKNKPHLIVGFSGGGHPLGDSKQPRQVADPLRSGKPFYCVACHEPHRSERPKLSRFDKGTQSCQGCHRM